MTKEEFEEGYAKRSGITLKNLKERYKARPCNCGEKGCPGWQIVDLVAEKQIKEWGKEKS